MSSDFWKSLISVAEEEASYKILSKMKRYEIEVEDIRAKALDASSHLDCVSYYLDLETQIEITRQRLSLSHTEGARAPISLMSALGIPGELLKAKIISSEMQFFDRLSKTIEEANMAVEQSMSFLIIRFKRRLEGAIPRDLRKDKVLHASVNLVPLLESIQRHYRYIWSTRRVLLKTMDFDSYTTVLEVQWPQIALFPEDSPSTLACPDEIILGDIHRLLKTIKLEKESQDNKIPIYDK